MRKLLALSMILGALSAGSAIAQTGAPAAAPAPAKQAAPAKKATPKKAAKPQSAASLACSKEADAKGLKGKARKSFRAKCLKAAKKKS